MYSLMFIHVYFLADTHLYLFDDSHVAAWAGIVGKYIFAVPAVAVGIVAFGIFHDHDSLVGSHSDTQVDSAGKTNYNPEGI